MYKIKGWIADFTGIAVALVALGIVAGVVFGDVPFVGTGYFDAVQTTITSDSSTTAMDGSTEEDQFE